MDGGDSRSSASFPSIVRASYGRINPRRASKTSSTRDLGMADLVFRYTILEIVLRCRFIPRVRMKTPYSFCATMGKFSCSLELASVPVRGRLGAACVGMSGGGLEVGERRGWREHWDEGRRVEGEEELGSVWGGGWGRESPLRHSTRWWSLIFTGFLFLNSFSSYCTGVCVRVYLHLLNIMFLHWDLRLFSDP